jgi:hypothetical protein
MPLVVLEPTILVFEETEMFDALDRVVSVFGHGIVVIRKYSYWDGR